MKNLSNSFDISVAWSRHLNFIEMFSYNTAGI